MALTSCAIAGARCFSSFYPPPAICRHSSVGRAAAIKAGLLATMQVRSLLSAPSPKADSVQGLKAGKPLPAGCVQICPVSKAKLWERPFDLPALNRALLRIRGPLSSGRIRKRGTRRCSSVGRAPRREVCAGSSPAICAKRGESLPLAMGKARLKVRQ